MEWKYFTYPAQSGQAGLYAVPFSSFSSLPLVVCAKYLLCNSNIATYTYRRAFVLMIYSYTVLDSGPLRQRSGVDGLKTGTNP